MNNLLYLSKTKGTCEYCGGRAYVNAIYTELSNTGEWHIMIEEQCHDCTRLDTTDIAWNSVTDDPEQIEASKAAANTPPRNADQSLDDPALNAFFSDLAELDAERGDPSDM